MRKFWFHTKWWFHGWYFLAKQHVYCRWFHRCDRCHPEVWGRGVDGPWHCDRCVPCGTAIDYILELCELDKKRRNP